MDHQQRGHLERWASNENQELFSSWRFFFLSQGRVETASDKSLKPLPSPLSPGCEESVAESLVAKLN